MRTCTLDRCGKPLPDDAPCNQKYCNASCVGKAHYYRNHEKLRLRRREYLKEHPSRKIWYGVKHRAKKSGIPFNLDIEDIVVPSHCPILGMKLRFGMNGGSGYHRDSPSLDRIDPKKGYIKGNVRVISSRANLLKSDAEPEELRKVLEDLERWR